MGVIKGVKNFIKDVISEPCTLFPNGIWADACSLHDHYADKLIPWLLNNWWLARNVAASTYSPKVVDMAEWKKICIRRVVAPLMFIGTSTIGWLWRVKALISRQALKIGIKEKTVRDKKGVRLKDRRLGLLFDKDDRSKSFRLCAVNDARKPFTNRWENNLYLDQGKEGACASAAFAHVLASEPNPVQNLTMEYAKNELYWPAQHIDPWPGGSYKGANPFYEGTTLLAILKIAKKLGWILGYRWVFSNRELQIGLSYHGPAYIGVKWFEGMYEAGGRGYIRPTGQIVGGHSVEIIAVDMENHRYTIRNSWGKDKFGLNGEAYISFVDMQYLISLGAEMAFIEGKQPEPIVDKRHMYTFEGRDPIHYKILIPFHYFVDFFKFLRRRTHV